MKKLVITLLIIALIVTLYFLAQQGLVGHLIDWLKDWIRR